MNCLDPLPKYSMKFYLKPPIKTETLKLISHDIVIPNSLLKYNRYYITY